MARSMRRATAAVAAAALLFGVAACGDDDEGDEAATDTTEADAGGSGGGEVDQAAFCDSYVEFNSAVFQVELDESSSEADVKAAGEQLAPTFQTIADNAPEDLADQADELNEAIQALREGDAEPFNADSTFETYSGFSEGVVDACEFESVEVTGIDYGYEGAPDTLAAGTVAFEFTNASESEEHELALLKRPEGETRTFAEILALPEEEAQSAVEFKGATFAPPGASGSTVAELDPGSYVMVCFIPVGGSEDPEAEAHWERGMIRELTVE